MQDVPNSLQSSSEGPQWLQHHRLTAWESLGIILGQWWHHPGTVLLCMARARTGTVVLVLDL